MGSITELVCSYCQYFLKPCVTCDIMIVSCTAKKYSSVDTIAFDSLNFYVLAGGSMLADILHALEEYLPVVKGM